MNRTVLNVAVAAIVTAGLSAAATIDVFIGAPGVDSSAGVGLVGTTTETFDSLAAGNYNTTYTSAIGDYTPSTTFGIRDASAVGGAGGAGQYLAFGIQTGDASPVTLEFPGEQNYFGFWWSAGDVNNGVTFYLGGVALGRFSTADVIDTIAGDLNYYGNPFVPGAVGGPCENTGAICFEPFAYIMFFGNGTTFDKVVFDNSGIITSGFETDNHSIFAGTIAPPDGSVPVGSVNTVPEPTTMALSGLGLLVIALSRRRRKA